MPGLRTHGPAEQGEIFVVARHGGCDDQMGMNQWKSGNCESYSGGLIWQKPAHKMVINLHQNDGLNPMNKGDLMRFLTICFGDFNQTYLGTFLKVAHWTSGWTDRHMVSRSPDSTHFHSETQSPWTVFDGSIQSCSVQALFWTGCTDIWVSSRLLLCSISIGLV